MPKISTFKDRLNYFLMRERLTKSELSRRTDVDKSSISHYCSGHWEGKQDVIYRIASEFNLNEAWLMGYDVPMYKNDFPKCIISDELLLSIPFISAISLFCRNNSIDISPILHYYQLPEHMASLKNLLYFGTPKLNDRIHFSNYLGISVEDAIRSVKSEPEAYLPLILSQKEIRLILAMRKEPDTPDN